MRSICSRLEIHRSGNTVTEDLVCRAIPQVTTDAVTTLTGDAE